MAVVRYYYMTILLGTLFAFVASVEVSAASIGSSIYTNLYPQLHQTSYFVMSVLSAGPILPLW